MTSPLRDSRADYEIGRRLALVLRGAWRRSPPAPDFTEADLEFALPHLKETFTAALAWWRIRRSALAETQIGAELRQQYVMHAVRSAHGTYRVFQYVSALKEQGIEPIVFKGWAMFPYYAEPGLRPVGDVDLAVAGREAERALAIMRQLGARPVDVDVHAELSDPAHSAFIPNSPWAELVRRSNSSTIGDLPVRVLNHADALQLGTIHCMRHLAARPVWVMDIAALVEARPPNLDWSRCLSVPPYASWITYGILLAHTLLGADIQDTPFAERTLELPEWLVRDVLIRWADPHALDQVVYPSILQLWREPARWQYAVRVRVPNRLAATLEYHGSLDQRFLVRHQIRALMRNVSSFARRNVVSKASS